MYGNESFRLSLVEVKPQNVRRMLDKKCELQILSRTQDAQREVSRAEENGNKQMLERRKMDGM